MGLVFGLFVFAGYFSNTYSEILTESIGRYGAFGMLIYVLGATGATIVAPLTFLPLLPVAVVLWGSFSAALLSIAAWTAGAVVAFVVARRFGQPVVWRLIGKHRIAQISKLFPEHHLFITVVLLRIALPVDLVSYALGLFSVMRFSQYTIATLLGIIPFAFALAYLSEVNTSLQVGALALGIIIIALGLSRVQKKYQKTFLSKEK